MFERFTEQARRAVFFARVEAGIQHADKITTGHLLMGLVKEGGLRVEAIAPLKDNAVQLRSALGYPDPPKALKGAELQRDLRLNDSSKKALVCAAQEAAVDGSRNIDADHLLRGLLRFPNEATTALQSLSLNLATARLASKTHRAEFPDKNSFYHWLFGSPFGAHRTLLIKLLAILIVCTLASLLIRWLN